MRLPETFNKFLDFHGPAKCGHDGCDKPAQYGLSIKVWAKGYDKSSTPLDALFTLKVCEDHRDEVNADTFWTPEGKDMIRKALKSMNRAEPDFTTTEFEWQPLAKLN